MMHKPLPLDISKIPLQGTLNGIPHVQNLTTYVGEWYPIIIEFEEVKQLLFQPRLMVDWRFATTSGGPYFTFRLGGALQAPIVAVSGTTIGWVSCDQDVVFEMLVGR